jgi:hypothetical protein
MHPHSASRTRHGTVIPGNAIDIVLTPEDTAVALGRPLAVRGGVMDKYRNLRSDPVTWSTNKSGISITSTGAVTATTVGRYRIIAAGAGFADTAMLSAVPRRLLPRSTSSDQKS